jgi:hypothetical protein
MWDIAFMLRMSVATMKSNKFLVCEAINKVLKKNIQFPTSEAGLASLAAGFAAISGGKAGIIPNVVAAVDSVCVRRKAPTITANSSASSAYNRKGYFASSFLAFVDSECRFLSVSMPCYSSSHDSTLFSCSKVLTPPPSSLPPPPFPLCPPTSPLLPPPPSLLLLLPPPSLLLPPSSSSLPPPVDILPPPSSIPSNYSTRFQ